MASKSKRRRKVLGASCILAALIIAGSSFAWFTSKDEVTNRLSATANYGVSIAEDFQPPENWIPGQTVDKNVGVVNTGNVDAFVRTWLEGEMRILKENSGVITWDTTAPGSFKDSSTTLLQNSDIYTDNTSDINSNIKDVKEQDMIDLNLTYSYTNSGTTYYLKQLSDKFVGNTDTQNLNNTTTPQVFNEIMAVQAGGTLVYVPEKPAAAGSANTTFKFTTPNQAISVTNSNGKIHTLAANTTYTVTIDSAGAAGVTGDANPNIYVDGTSVTIKTLADLPNEAVDSDTFKPITTGLYVFKRNEDLTGAEHTTNDDPEFSGYYYVAKSTSDNGGEGIYFALHNGVASSDTDRSEYTLPSDAWTYNQTGGSQQYVFAPTNNLSLYTAKRELIENNSLDWSKSDNTLTASYGTGDQQIKVDVTLANLGTAAETWTALEKDDSGKKSYTFYYNNDVEEGATTAKLVDAVTLNNATKKEAYLAFDFDLNVKMDSVQVTVDDKGNETVTAAQTEFSSGDAPVKINNTMGVKDNGTAPEAGALTWSTNDLTPNP